MVVTAGLEREKAIERVKVGAGKDMLDMSTDEIENYYNLKQKHSLVQY